MKKILLSTVVGLLLVAPTLSANDTQVRLGMSTTSGTYIVEDAAGNETADIDLNDGQGFEISLVTGIDTTKGFDFRSAITLQSNEIRMNRLDSSDIMLIGEFEFAYNINEYISPFIGLYGGVGMTDVSTTNYSESGLLTYDLGVMVGVSGAIYQGLGYYAKYTTGMKGYNIDDDVNGIRQSPSSIKAGISYTF